VKIEILGTGCPKCKMLYENANKAIAETGIKAEVIKIEDMEHIIECGVMITPAIVINGEIKSSGKVLSPEEIKQWLI